MAYYGVKPGEVLKIPLRRCCWCNGWSAYDLAALAYVCLNCGRSPELASSSKRAFICKTSLHSTFSPDRITLRIAADADGQPTVELDCTRCLAGDTESELFDRRRRGRSHHRKAEPAPA